MSGVGALLSALSDAECLLLRTPLGPVYARLGSIPAVAKFLKFDNRQEAL
jgi:hypothetical protein